MDKRIRSPNYPAISLPAAIDKIRALYDAQHTHAPPREVIAKNIGYNSLNGASATVISALNKYGLLQREGEDLKVSERALRILIPHSNDERAAAIKEAAEDPPLFGELTERFPGQAPNEALLRNYLLRKSFAPSAVSGVITAYRETSEFVSRHGGAQDSGQEHAPHEAPRMHTTMDFSPPELKQATPLPAVSEEEPYRVTLSRTGIEIAARLKTVEDVEELIQALNAWKQLVKPAGSRSLPPRGEALEEDDDEVL